VGAKSGFSRAVERPVLVESVRTNQSPAQMLNLRGSGVATVAKWVTDRGFRPDIVIKNRCSLGVPEQSAPISTP